MTSDNTLQLTTSSFREIAGRNTVEAIKLLYDQYGGLLYGMLCKKEGDEKSAEHILSKTFTSAYHQIHSLDTGQPLFQWLLEITRKLCGSETKNDLTEVPGEDKILYRIFCSGSSVQQVAKEMNIEEAQVGKMLRTMLMKYKSK
ncbi:MAG: hypothetical protein H7X71_05520 [Chitinophagales bacterium]|nr:hypothetical protein [Chitinophagales bacterium]